MLVVSCHLGELQTITDAGFNSRKEKGFVANLPAIDALLPGGAFSLGAVHELLSEPDAPSPLFFAAMLARAAAGGASQKCRNRPLDEVDDYPSKVIVWSDPLRQLYPPAILAADIPLENLLVLHPRDEKEELWAAAECMRCRGVGATIVSARRLSRLEARRLQLAAETGGGAGILLRKTGAGASEYAAATRWLVGPVPGTRLLQRWRLQLIHGHGGRIAQCVILEVCRETNHVRAFEAMGNRSDPKTEAKRWA